jgi:hypothetical protein
VPELHDAVTTPGPAQSMYVHVVEPAHALSEGGGLGGHAAVAA